jgi:RHS repeat-associated protein
MTMPGRNYSSNLYRYGFNGKENDNEAGEGIQDYGLRIYDCRLAKFLSVDPLAAEYPWLTPYQFAAGNSISGVDLDGAEYYYAADGKFVGQGSDEKSTEVRLGAITGKTQSGKDLITSIDANGKASNNWTVLHKDHETFKKILGTVYTETSAKGYNSDEAAGIYSVMKNRAEILGIEIGTSLFEKTGIYGWKEGGKIKSTTQQVMDGKIDNADAKYRDVFRGVVAAISTGKDYSGGGTTWHGNDFSLKGWSAYKNYYLAGFNFTDDKHDIYSMGNHPNNSYTLTGVVNNESIEVNLRYKYLSTGAAGGTLFMKRSYWSFAPDYPAIKQFYLQNRSSMAPAQLKASTEVLINRFVKGIARF